MFLTVWGHQQIIIENEYSFDTNIMKEMGVKYLLCDKFIRQKENSKLQFIKEFPPLQEQAYSIYLYKLLD